MRSGIFCRRRGALARGHLFSRQADGVVQRQFLRRAWLCAGHHQHKLAPGRVFFIVSAGVPHGGDTDLLVQLCQLPADGQAPLRSERLLQVL